MPVAKHHGLSRLTLGLKNIMGIMGGKRGDIHSRSTWPWPTSTRISERHLTIIDATRILTAHGPQGGNIADVKVLNKVIASTDIVAADAFATTLFGMNPSEIPVTVAAHKRGLGEMDLDRIRVVKA